jgi:hypothetical protein
MVHSAVVQLQAGFSVKDVRSESVSFLGLRFGALLQASFSRNQVCCRAHRSSRHDIVLQASEYPLCDTKGLFGKAPASASLAPDPDLREKLILLILLENQDHF